MILSILTIAAPLLLITLGALVSEYAGRLAMFMEHSINAGAFCCFAFTLATGNLVLGMALSVLTCTLFVVALEKTAARFDANMFLVSLAMNLLFASLTTFFSVVFFKNRGVLTDEAFRFNAPVTRAVTTVLCYSLVGVLLFFIKKTMTGRALRVTGSDSEVLRAYGKNPAWYRTLSWIVAAASGALAGGVFAARLSAFVPGVSAGRGWTALAAVFLGRKHPLLIVLSVLVFAIAEYASTTIQNIPLFARVPSSILLALPYLLALLLLIIVPQKTGHAQTR